MKNHKISLKVVPNSSKTQLIETDAGLKLYLKSVPKKDKANQELIKYFKKNYLMIVEISAGFKSRKKTIKVLHTSK